jgi:prolyl 4-hydroxylase
VTDETIAQRALRLLAAGEPDAAVALVDAAPQDGQAQMLRGLWLVEGRFVARDMAAARACLDRAARLGSAPAARILTGFLATGRGGPVDWPGAMAVLRDWADRDPQTARQLGLLGAMALDETGDPTRAFEREMLSEAPAIAIVPGLLDAAECRYLIDIATPRLKPATIFLEREQRFAAHPVRRSEAAGFPIVSESPAIHAINRRIAAASGTQVRQGEPLQVLRYGPGQEYRAHLDAVPGLANQRALTVLVYLNEGYDGGETVFPDRGIAVRARTGDALIFANTGADGRPDPATRHAGLPVTRGTKFVASRWIRARAAGPDEEFEPAEVERG